MILCLDMGNSHLYGGVFQNDTLILRFRHTSVACTSDMLGIFLKQVLLENGCNPASITKIAIASVVPAMDYSLRSACIKYFSIEPFILQADTSAAPLTIHYHRAGELGADRLANAIAAVHTFPATNLIIIDFGTATTYCAISAEAAYLGGAILPGVRLSIDALAKNTAKLPSVEILKMSNAVGKNTVESIQSGVFYGVIGACKELIMRFKQELFEPTAPVMVLATGGLAPLFEQAHIYDQLMPDLVLDGLRLAVLA